VGAVAEVADAHAETLMVDQTYLQHAQPSTFGHVLLGSAYPVLRTVDRLTAGLDGINRSPAGAGGVNGSPLVGDRGRMAALLGFDGVIEHTRDAMWQSDGLTALVGDAATLATTLDRLAEDLEIYASAEFGWVVLGEGPTRSSVLMPQKRNPYALTMVRGATGVLIGRATGMLALAKSPSARSDNLIFAYGEVPRALGLALRTTQLTTGVVRTLTVNAERMRSVLQGGFSQATDLAEFVMADRGIDYRTAYRVVGHAVRLASARGLRGIDIDGSLVDEAAKELTGQPLGLAGRDLTPVLDPGLIVTSRTSLGGAAPAEVTRMARDVGTRAGELAAQARAWRERYLGAERALVATARRCVAAASDAELAGIAAAAPGQPTEER